MDHPGHLARISHRPSRGVSLVEMMVSVTISLILLAGILQVFAGNKASYEMNDDLSRLQENARFALAMMVRDLRMAGYFGCMDDVSQVFNHVNGAGGGALLDTGNGIEGYEQDPDAGTSAAQWEPSNSTALVATIGGAAAGDMVAGADAFTVRYLDGRNPIAVVPPFMPQASGNIKTAVSDLQQGEIVAITDCSSADLFQITGPNGTGPGDNGLLVHNTGAATTPGNTNALVPGCPGANAQCLSKVYEGDSQVLRLVARRYYVGVGTNGPSLFQETVAVGTNAAPTAVELVEGIESMQLRYGEDTTGDRVPDAYVVATAVTDWTNVVSVRIAMLARTIDAIGQETDTATYTLEDATVGPMNDRRRRRVFTTTVLMRNLQ